MSTNGSKKRKRTASTIKGVPAHATSNLLACLKKGSRQIKQPKSDNICDQAKVAKDTFINQLKHESPQVHIACLVFLLDTVEKHDHPWELRLSSLSAVEAILTRSKVSRIYFVENRVREFFNTRRTF